MKKENTALAIIEKFELPALNDNMAAAMSDELDGLPLTFPRVRIPSGGGLTFEIPGDDPENPDTEREIVGVIVDHHPVNVYWSDKYAGLNNPPDCSSMDGKIGITIEGVRKACNSCPLNNWGTAEDGRGKACKNMRRIYILREGEVLPLLLTLPPTSLKPFADYMGPRVVAKNLRSFEVVTRISLKKVQNANGINYSQAVFSLVGKLSPEQAKAMAEYSKQLKAITRKLAIEADEYIQPLSDDDIDHDRDENNDDEEVPF